jgi:hypothetical protein
VLRNFIALQNPSSSAGFQLANLGSNGKHSTIRPPRASSLNKLLRKQTIHPQFSFRFFTRRFLPCCLCRRNSSCSIISKCSVIMTTVCTYLFSFCPTPALLPSIWLELLCCIINVTNTAVKRLICNTLQPTSFHNFTVSTDRSRCHRPALRTHSTLPSKREGELI